MQNYLSTAEEKELNRLKELISFNSFSVVPETQELFAQLFVKSLRGKGDYCEYSDPTNY